jgi:hypothetical protein
MLSFGIVTGIKCGAKYPGTYPALYAIQECTSAYILRHERLHPRLETTQTPKNTGSVLVWGKYIQGHGPR